MSDILFWDTNSPAGSGTVWNTGLAQQTMRQEDINLTTPIYRPYIDLMVSAPTDARVRELRDMYAGTHAEGKITIQSMDEMFETEHFNLSKDEIKEIEDEAMNKMVHGVFKKLLS